ncbi:MAG: RimK family alpha-L-glutamate ligase [Desulfobacteraceae bacterium]|nr:RimK family alpha-L-glutamate ligase [Desulfobacteraceae bacterium]
MSISETIPDTSTNVIVTLEKRLKSCSGVKVLGVRPNFEDYSFSEKNLIYRANKIYYPSSFYAELFHAMGKPIFPSLATYCFAQDKIKQTAIFKLNGISHPRTRVFYGKRRKEKILEYFDFPFIAKIPRGSAMGKGVFLIDSQQMLNSYCQLQHAAYIQEYLPIERDMRVVVIGNEVVHAYWRVAKHGDFRTNVAAGASIDLSPVPVQVLNLAIEIAKVCGWNDVGLDICEYQGRFYVLEANMKYGRKGFYQAGIDYKSLLLELITQGKI